jgi:hypothetical protein
MKMLLDRIVNKYYRDGSDEAEVRITYQNVPIGYCIGQLREEMIPGFCQ